MIEAPKALPSNRLVSSLAYPKILRMYNEILQREGRVNAKKFYEEIVSKEIHSYSMRAWYQFLKRFKTPAGIVATEIKDLAREINKDENRAIEVGIPITILSNQAATAKLIANILNISADAAQKIIEDPTLLTTKERIELGLKGMKAQDSRIHAVGKIREDNREQERFDRAFDAAAYGE